MSDGPMDTIATAEDREQNLGRVRKSVVHGLDRAQNVLEVLRLARRAADEDAVGEVETHGDHGQQDVGDLQPGIEIDATNHPLIVVERSALDRSTSRARSRMARGWMPQPGARSGATDQRRTRDDDPTQSGTREQHVGKRAA